jgi:hypothetical protein
LLSFSPFHFCTLFHQCFLFFLSCWSFFIVFCPFFHHFSMGIEF